MALIQCPECKTEVSEKAGKCPKCGHPINAVSIKKVGKVFGAIIGGVLMAIGGLAVIGVGWKYFHKPAPVAKPVLPIEVKYRKALLSNGLVAIFKNKTNEEITVLATFTNPKINVSKSFKLDLGSFSTVEFGHLQGWDFDDGDLITLENNEYAVFKTTLP